MSNQAGLLYRLQIVDLDIAKRRARLKEIDAKLNNDETIAQATQQLDAAEKALKPWQTKARDELVRIVQTLEGGQAPLEDTLTMWERGEAVAARCSQILDGAQERLSGRTSTPSPEAR